VRPSVRSAKSSKSTSAANGNAPAAQAHDGGTVGCVGLCELQYVIEAPAPQQGGIDLLGTIGGCQQHHTFYVPQVVDLTQELAENPLIDVAAE